MSLKHVQPSERLSVSLGFLRAVTNTIKAGKLQPGLPLYPDDTCEFFEEILKVPEVIERQQAEIAQLKEELKQVTGTNERIQRDLRLNTARASRTQTRLEQLSDTVTSEQTGEQHEIEQSHRTTKSPDGERDTADGVRESGLLGGENHVSQRASEPVRLLNGWDDF